MEPKQRKLKLEFDLGCWRDFFMVCHNYEDAFLYDDQYRVCHDISNPHYPGDVTERDLNWSVEDLFDQLYLEEVKHLYGDKAYQEYLSPAEDAKIRKQLHQKHILFLIIGSIFLVLGIFSLITIPFFSYHHMQLHIYVFSLVAFISILGIITLYFLDHQYLKKRIALDKDAVNHNQSFEQWFKNQYEEDQAWLNYLSKARRNFSEEVLRVVTSKSREDELKTIIHQKEELKRYIPLPKEYQTEYYINRLFGMVLMGRAETLDDAISLLKEDQDIIRVSYNVDSLNLDINRIREGFLHLAEDDWKALDPEFRDAITPNEILVKEILSIKIEKHIIKAEDLVR